MSRNARAQEARVVVVVRKDQLSPELPLRDEATLEHERTNPFHPPSVQ